jgi:hypothetical protein
MLVILATGEAEIWRIVVRDQLGQIVPRTPLSKITRAKLNGGVPQAVEHLLCSRETLSSNISTTKKNKKAS